MRNRPSRLILLTSVGVLTLTLLAIGSPRPASALPPICFPLPPIEKVCIPNPAPGIAGGGVVQTASGEAHVSLFASRLVIEGATGEEPVMGAVMWLDPTWEETGLVLASTRIDYYAPVPGLDGGREIRGLMTANGEGAYPFVLLAVDSGLPGAGQDRVALAVGTFAEGDAAAASDFGYSAEGAVVGGDLQLLIPGTPPAGTPTP
ncbi:MAG: hypothetical protein ACRDJW_08445 [Thermomicrobiales bacterium]